MVKALVTRGVPLEIAKKFKRTTCLQLIRTDPEAVYLLNTNYFISF